ncbi:hypothetical protein D9M73_240790 [compost metagenome]
MTNAGGNAVLEDPPAEEIQRFDIFIEPLCRVGKTTADHIGGSSGDLCAMGHVVKVLQREFSNARNQIGAG